MRELERARAKLLGQRGQYAASVAQTKGSARENHIQALEAERSFRERAAFDMREVENSLGEVLPKWTAARDQLVRTAIRSGGQKLMDIVAEHTPLLIQARIAPDDANDLSVGHQTLAKFPGFMSAALPTSMAGSLA